MSCDSSLDLNSATAPNSFAIFSISVQSLETIVVSTYLLSKEASIVQAIKGLPANCKIFFLGSLLLPPRAGIIAITLLLFMILYPFYSYFIISFKSIKLSA